MIAYYLAKNNFVLKTNIDESEKRYIKESKNLKFRTVDATKMPFQDDSFDVTYSISVVEHIYEKYLAAIREMVRVTRKKGIIFITFPVSSSHCEEWSRKTMYSHQARKDGKTFFQYRFSKADIQGILDAIGEVRVIACDIFWEKVDGRYDEMIALLSKHSFNNYVRFLRNSFIMFFMGFCLFKEKSQNFSHAKSFGNLQLVLKKK
jgi:predicted SAM-dependent methyltransferase